MTPPRRLLARAAGPVLVLVFVFALSIDRPTIPFGTIDPGGTVDLTDRNAVTVQAGDGVVWYLTVRHFGDVPGLTLGFRTSGGRGTGTPAWTAMRETPALAYTSSVSEGVTGPFGVPITFGYRLSAAADAEGGPRSWVITYTLSEAP